MSEPNFGEEVRKAASESGYVGELILLADVDKLALKIADEVIKVCNGYIGFENGALEVGVPEITEKNKKNLKIFLRGLACRMAMPAQLKEEMVRIKQLMKSKEKPKHFKDLYKLANEDARALMDGAGAIGASGMIAEPIYLTQYPLKLKDFMKNVEKQLETTYQEEKEGKQIDWIIGEIKNSVSKSKDKVEIWNEYLEKFREEIKGKYRSYTPKGILETCAKEISDNLASDYSGYLNRIKFMQEKIADELNKYKEEPKYTDEELPEKIDYCIEKYIENLKNIIDKIQKESEYYKLLNLESQYNVNLVCEFLNKNLEKCTEIPQEPYLEKAQKFLRCAEYINSGLIVGNKADKEIKNWYNRMNFYCNELSRVLNSGRKSRNIVKRMVGKFLHKE